MQQVYVVRIYDSGCDWPFLNLCACETWTEAWELANKINSDHCCDYIDVLPIVSVPGARGDVK